MKWLFLYLKKELIFVEKQNYNFMYFIHKHFTSCLLVLFFSVQIHSQTIGLLHNTVEASEGYTLFSPDSNNSVYLINNCGEAINEWTFTERPGLTCYLLENGNLLRAGQNSLETRDWDNNIVWSYDMQAAGYNQHHDIEPLPNGNILCLLRYDYTSAEIIAEGKDPNFIDAVFKLDELIELQPVGTNSATVVWEWKFMDHFIQDFDNTKANYGSIIDHPELIDINFNNLTTDITHLNSIDYNQTLDQIIISARHMSEIYILDHSTTTAEAATHSGGDHGKGGDLLWRWGNPLAYKQGTLADQKLFLQHDARWVKAGYADGGKISVFNNGGDGSYTFSSIHILTPEIIAGDYQMENSMYKPTAFEWSWNGSILGTTVHEGKKSGTQSLPNGNMMVCETASGRISEIKKDGTLLWSYKNPTGLNNSVYTQNETVVTANSFFRSDKYPTNYIGFTGKDLTPGGIIENQNSISEDCINLLNIHSTELNDITVINPSTDNIIRFNNIIQLDSITIYDMNGRKITVYNNFNSNYLETNLAASIYILELKKGNSTEFIKIITN
jgi:hypothetical protein